MVIKLLNGAANSLAPKISECKFAFTMFTLHAPMHPGSMYGTGSVLGHGKTKPYQEWHSQAWGKKKDKSQAQRTTDEVQEGFEMREVIFSQRADYEGFMMLLAQI